MHAHSQYCVSGDYTLEATERAITDVTSEEADDYLVLVVSDANFDRYGISAEEFGKVLLQGHRVNIYKHIYVTIIIIYAYSFGIPLVLYLVKPQW